MQTEPARPGTDLSKSPEHATYVFNGQVVPSRQAYDALRHAESHPLLACLGQQPPAK